VDREYSKKEKYYEDGIGFEMAKKPLSSNSIVLITKGILEGPQSF